MYICHRCGCSPNHCLPRHGPPAGGWLITRARHLRGTCVGQTAEPLDCWTWVSFASSTWNQATTRRTRLQRSASTRKLARNNLLGRKFNSKRASTCTYKILQVWMWWVVGGEGSWVSCEGSVFTLASIIFRFIPVLWRATVLDQKGVEWKRCLSNLTQPKIIGWFNEEIVYRSGSISLNRCQIVDNPHLND